MMNDMKIYVTNLGKYIEGELVSGWFTLPVDYDDMKKRIGLNNEYKEYVIQDYSLPLDISAYTSIDDINHLFKLLEKMKDTPLCHELKKIQQVWFCSLAELLAKYEDIVCYEDCYSMADVAYHIVKEIGAYEQIPSNLQDYIDYQSLGRDMEIEGNFLVTKHGVFEYRA